MTEFTARRDDIEAVHVCLINSFWIKALSRASPIPWSPDLQVTRALHMWRRKLRGWLRGPLPLDRFDAVLVSPQLFGMAFGDARAAGRKFVLATHMDATVMNAVRDFGDSKLLTYPMFRAERRLFQHTDIVAAFGDWALDSAHDDCGVPRERLMWVPPTVDVPARRPARPPREGRLFRIVFVGNAWVRKGGPDLLRWHQQRWADRAELHFVGAEAVPDPTAKNVVWHGRVDNKRIVQELLPTMDLFVLPTRREMSSWAGVEAMACGLPVVLPRVGGIPSLVVEGETGHIVPMGDERAFIAAIERIMDGPGLCERMGEAAHAHAQRTFAHDVVYGKLIDRIRELRDKMGDAR